MEKLEKIVGIEDESFKIKSEKTQVLSNFLESSAYAQYDFLEPKEKFTYGVWRTDKPKEEGYSHELISPDAKKILYNTDLDSLEANPFDGVDTLLKAFRRNVIRNPNQEYFGTKVNGKISIDMSHTRKFGEEKYEWKTLKEVAEDAENFSLGCMELDLCPEVEGEGKQWRFLGIQSRNRSEWYTAHLGNMH